MSTKKLQVMGTLVDSISVAIAGVGQTIVVKTVDENGKPTEWEAIDFPEYEEFVFTLEDGTTVTKNIAVKGDTA